MKTSKSPLVLLFMIPFFLTLMGCPISSEYPLDKEGNVKIDEKLIGTWVTDNENAEVKKVKVEKGSDTSYTFFVEEKGSSYNPETLEFKGWLAKLKGRTFLVLQEKIGENYVETYYLYHLKIEKDQIVTNDVGLMVGGKDAVTSINTYKDEVIASMTNEGFLGDELVFKKVIN